MMGGPFCLDYWSFECRHTSDWTCHSAEEEGSGDYIYLYMDYMNTTAAVETPVALDLGLWHNSRRRQLCQCNFIDGFPLSFAFSCLILWRGYGWRSYKCGGSPCVFGLVGTMDQRIRFDKFQESWWFTVFLWNFSKWCPQSPQRLWDFWKAEGRQISHTNTWYSTFLQAGAAIEWVSRMVDGQNALPTL